MMPSPSLEKNLKNMVFEELLSLMDAMGEKPFRAKQIYAWVFRRGVLSIDEMTDIKKEFRERLKTEGYYISKVRVSKTRKSSDHTIKLLVELPDGVTVESVLIPEGKRLTLCVSTQAGCALGCLFCVTGSIGAGRNLTMAEMCGIVHVAADLVSSGGVKGFEAITNVVLMGMGEPLYNYDEVSRFLRALIDAEGMAFSPRKVTLSTAGVVPGIKRLGRESDVNIAVSLNATTDEVRSRLMPINKKYPISELLEALKEYPLKNRRFITFEYVLIKGVNDALEDARRLVKLLKGIPSKINLIPFNPFSDSGFERPDGKTIEAFKQLIHDAGYVVSLRASKGADIQAACGQLKGKG